jgi:hypothetical protein
MKKDFLRHVLRCSKGRKSPAPLGQRGKCLGRTVGRVIPRQVASPQSLTPFHPATRLYRTRGAQLVSRTSKRVYRTQDHWLGLN